MKCATAFVISLVLLLLLDYNCELCSLSRSQGVFDSSMSIAGQTIWKLRCFESRY